MLYIISIKMSTDDKEFKCYKCNTIFASFKNLSNHLQKKDPCDFKCKYCGLKSHSRRSYYRHKSKCEINKKDNVEDEDSQDHKDKTSTLNTVNAPVSDSSVNIGRDVNNNHNNTLMMTPCGLEHVYMKHEEEIGELRGDIRYFIQHYDFPRAYDRIYTHVHSNPQKPQNHNHFLHKMFNEDMVYALKGGRFKYVKADEFSKDMYEYLRFEMDWLTKTDITLTPEERDQMRWDIKANWMIINANDDPNLKRLMRNNKDIVLNTFKKYERIYPDKELAAKLKKIKPESITNFDNELILDYE